jgi:hypothetical protein
VICGENWSGTRGSNPSKHVDDNLNGCAALRVNVLKGRGNWAHRAFPASRRRSTPDKPNRAHFGQRMGNGQVGSQSRPSGSSMSSNG